MMPVVDKSKTAPDGPRYGGVNGGPLKSEVADPLEREIRETFDQFDNVYLSDSRNWLWRQRTGRLCEDIIRIVERARSAAALVLADGNGSVTGDRKSEEKT